MNTFPKTPCLRIWRSYKSFFGYHVHFPNDLDDETITAINTYSDDELRRIAGLGFNAIWVHGQLHHLIRHPRYPEFGVRGERHIDALKTLIGRAARHGLKIFLYIQPPRAIAADDPFWLAHAEDGGMTVETIADNSEEIFHERSLCTSLAPVRDYIRDSFAALAELLPELGGLIVISASEYPAHCYSRRNCRPGVKVQRRLIMDQVPTECPRCGLRAPEEVVSELLQTIRDGVRRVSAELPVIFWDWGWSMYCDPPYETILKTFPADCILMSDFERGGMRADGTYIDEYSLGYAGPSETFSSVASLAGARGIRVMAKLQLGTTHELATVRSLPIMPSIYRKAAFVRDSHLPGFMGCWNFGNLPSSNPEAFNFFLQYDPELGEDAAMTAFARKKFPGTDETETVSAWKLFAESMEFYPFSVPFLYASPLNYTLGLIPKTGPLDGKSAGRSWLPDERGDSLEECITKEFPLDNIIERLHRMSGLWSRGLEHLAAGAGKGTPDYANAAICGAVWRSGRNTFRIYRLRKDWNESRLPLFRKIVSDELSLCRDVLPYVESDPCQGRHIEGNFTGFSAGILKTKIAALERMLRSV